MWNQPTKDKLTKIPRLYETEEIPLKEKEIHLHFFFGGSDWYIIEYDQEDTFFGFAILNDNYQCAEWGYVSFSELKSVSVGGFEIDCELNWKIKKASEIEKICIAQGWPYVNKRNRVAVMSIGNPPRGLFVYKGGNSEKA